ncbi:sigma 54-interacting transcriptional regulator [Flavobacteriaceae bacterium]|nr:sigma 54-interacting transcriptional regulator [Flavobacteriaceae bacterium]MDB4133967.1 sigma 54-interacting transcriptional regulator [Flavobacteriaceae bacterium]MDB4179685.1 sigma 54-interacting transcriptional regulator [Flavobacteriaceae bacterium]MDC0496910.1 sigma 54-interacting transcriptional regulator [Flavobacteriaceae bacterium]
MESVQAIKQRFGIIGNDPILNRALEKALKVAPTEISVLVTGESGVGKESIPKITHQFSHRKHAKYIAVNCGAIPEGTIDSELFGHEKGAFTGATSDRKGYFEVADGGTIFLDEVGELPLTTQVRLLRVLENGEFIKVGSSKVQKTNIRIVAATNMDMFDAIRENKFREDLYYRLSTVEIKLPALRDRKEDIHLLFRKFSSDFALKYKMPSIKLDKDALELLINYNWNGNIRQLKNVAEQISVLERERNINKETLINYLPNSQKTNLPAVIKKKQDTSDFSNEREILYKVLFDMKNDLNDLKKLTMELMKNDNMSEFQKNNENLIQKIYEQDKEVKNYPIIDVNENQQKEIKDNNYQYVQELDSQETLSLHDKELELIKKSLERHDGKRKLAAEELGISERTLYRKIKQFDL